MDSSMSALHQFILANEPPRNQPAGPVIHHLALQIAHNLRFQHDWTELRLHYHASAGAKSPLPRPIISGMPPRRLYVHPDEQIELLEKQRRAGSTRLPELPAEREWVCPSHLREPWTLSRFADVFDALSVVPVYQEGGQLFFGTEAQASQPPAPPTDPIMNYGIPRSEASTRTPTRPPNPGDDVENPWRNKAAKRMLLATVDSDSTVVYYIVHDGIVKPRQN